MTNSLGERVKALRLEAGETQIELAKAIDSTQVLVSNVERGITQQTHALALIAQHYGVSAVWLKTGEGDKQDAREKYAQEMLRFFYQMDPVDRDMMYAILKLKAQKKK
jgi:transcriptional regulator with XRE-family HTH domain